MSYQNKRVPHREVLRSGGLKVEPVGSGDYLKTELLSLYIFKIAVSILNELEV